MTPYLALIAPFLLAGILFASSDIKPGMNRFAGKAYRELAKGNDNLILSPFSISTALSMLLAGARGPTADEMAATLDQLRRDADYHNAVASLAAELAKGANTGGNQLSIANGLWVQHGLPLEAPFEQTIRTLYAAPLSLLDFQADPKQACTEINSWTAQHTKGRIPQLFAPGSIDSGTRLVLTSAIYFYGKWRAPFDPADTHPAPFKLGAGRSTQAKFMYRKSSFLYTETPSAQVLEMKYDGTPLVFDILLPKRDGGLAEVEQSINPKALAEWFGALERRTVEVTIPKFRAESAFSLKETLSRMGMAAAFGSSADFSGIDGRRDLFLSEVVHKAFVEVSEEGTEAAAATGGIVSLLAARPQQDTIFRADHPFVFFIRDTASGVILFEGRLLNPKS